MKSIIERLRKLEQIAPDKLVILADFDEWKRNVPLMSLKQAQMQALSV